MWEDSDKAHAAEMLRPIAQVSSRFGDLRVIGDTPEQFLGLVFQEVRVLVMVVSRDGEVFGHRNPTDGAGSGLE